MNIIKEEKFLNYDIIEYDVVDTTMNAVKNFKANTIIIAQKQTSGKGKGNRVWNSENNNNLYFSLIIEANNNKLDYSQVSFITSVAMRYAISEFDNKNNSIISKWPNDILINNKKAVGILLEFDNNKLIIGPGVNINFFPDNVNFNATSLKNEGIIVDKYTLLKRFLANFDYLFKEWEQNGFSSIRTKWLKSSYKLHQTIKVGDIEGIFEDIDNDGTLIVKMANGKYHFIKSGDVF